MLGIPPAKDTDAEDVAWGLQTADALWKRGERADAIVWLRRAAQAAGDASDDDRALELARRAAELQESIEGAEEIDVDVASLSSPPAAAPPLPGAPAPPPVPPAPPPPAPPAALVGTAPAPAAPRPPPVPSARPAPPAAPSAPPGVAAYSDPPPHLPTASQLPPFPSPSQLPGPASTSNPPMSGHTPSVPPAEAVHAGMYNPWEDSTGTQEGASAGAPPPPPPPPPTPPPVPARPAISVVPIPAFAMKDGDEEEEEVVTSVRPQDLAASQALAASPAPPAAAPPAPEPPRPAAPRPAAPRPTAPRAPAAPRAPTPPAPKPDLSPRRYTPTPTAEMAIPPEGALLDGASLRQTRPDVEGALRAAAQAVEDDDAIAAAQAAEDAAARDAAAAQAAEDAAAVEAAEHAAAEQAATEQAAAERAAAEEAAAAEQGAAEEEAAAQQTSASPEDAALVLDDVEAFADLPDEDRERFAAAAALHTLAREEEVAGFGLAFILAGEVDVAATMVDAPAVRLVEGAVIRARGTTEDGVPMRLICSSDHARLATWTDDEVADAFRTCPWVEDDLRAHADRYQTLVGITIGPLGERLDAQIRAHIVSRLTMKRMLPGEIVVEAGHPVSGLFLVAVGELELVQGDEVTGAVGSGDFLFAGAVLGGGNAPATARAGKNGALMMYGEPSVAQELLVTCPPLLEVFAGM